MDTSSLYIEDETRMTEKYDGRACESTRYVCGLFLNSTLLNL